MMGVLNHLSTLLLLSLLPAALSHVVENFSDVPQCKMFFLEGTTPNLPGILVDGTVQNQNRYKPICQKYKKTYRFATLYDTTNMIPVFSAYTFTGPPTDPRPDDPWMIEPQLDGVNSAEMRIQDGRRYEHQAEQKDYKNSKYKSVNRGHLFPSSHAHYLETQESTFTLTNTVPQDISFNDGSWKEMERNVRGTLVKNCKDANDQIKAYVVTGAVPNNNNKNKLNQRVNIPYLMWTAFCCENKKYKKNKKWMAGAHWGLNKKEEALNQLTLGALEEKLNKYHKDKDVPVKVFPGYCPRVTKPTTSS